MKCQWQSLIDLLPTWLRENVDKLGKDRLQELRLRLDYPPVLVFQECATKLDRPIKSSDLDFCINVATKYSPWSAKTVAHGYITAPGGHRIGLGGKYISSDSQNLQVRTLTSLCIRVARDFPGIAEKTSHYQDSVLIIGAPGCGKTTLLRDMVRQRGTHTGKSIVVVDEREEIFPQIDNRPCFPTGIYTDVISGCSKYKGVEMAIRNMGPDTIALDEITAAEDCDALIYAGWCGVKLVATAHAASTRELFCRPVYKPLVDSGIFQHVLVIGSDKQWHAERLTK